MRISIGYMHKGGCVKHAVFDRWILDDRGRVEHEGSHKAVDFYMTHGQWADEISGVEPEPQMEPFYLLVALKLGDPEKRSWVEDNAMAFYEMLTQWLGRDVGMDKAAVLIQYLLWYERDRPKLT